MDSPANFPLLSFDELDRRSDSIFGQSPVLFRVSTVNPRDPLLVGVDDESESEPASDREREREREKEMERDGERMHACPCVRASRV